MPTRFGIGPVTRETVRMLRRNWLALGLIVVAVSVLTQLADSAVVAASGSGDLREGLVEMGTGVFEMGLSVAVQGVTTALIWADLSIGRRSLSTALRTGVGKTVPLIALTIAVIVPVLLGLVFLIVPGVLLLLRWSVASCVRVVEGPGLRDALRRSAVLTEGNRGPILGVYALYLVAIAAVVPLSVRLAGLLSQIPFAESLLVGLLNNALQCVFATIFTVVYAELRREQEGGRPDDVAALFE